MGVTAEPAHFVGRKDPSVPAPIRTLVFASAKPAGKPVYRTVKLEDGGVAVVAITASRLDPSGLAPERNGNRLNEAAASRGAGDIAAYVEELRGNSKVVKNPKAFE